MRRRSTRRSISIVPAAGLIALGLALPSVAAAQSALPRPSELPPAGGPGSAPPRPATPQTRPSQTPAAQAPAAQAQPARPPAPAQAGPPGAGPPGAGQPAPARPYKPVTITAPTPVTDPSFEAFRKQLGEAAGHKDRAALARLVAPSFFWLAAQGDKADRKKPAIDNLAAAIELDAVDGGGWELLASAAGDATLQPLPQRRGVQCAPAAPVFDDKAFEQLLRSSRTEVFEWAYPARGSVAVRASAAADAPVTETLTGILVRVLPEPDQPPPGGAPAAGAPGSTDGPGSPGGPGGGAMPPLRVVTPAGKTGFVAADAVLPLIFEQLCYVKDASGWKIAGYLGGE